MKPPGRSLIPRLNIGTERSLLATEPAGEEIPRIVHQTYHSRPLPPALQANIEKIRAMNPEYEYRFYDDADMAEFIRSNYGARILDYFQRINPTYGAARADLFRYLLIYRCGGVYLDIKSSLNRPLREVLAPGDRYLLSQWHNRDGERYAEWGLHPELQSIPGGEFQQWHLVAAPGHPFLKAVLENVLVNIDHYHPIWHGLGYRGVFRVTGPIAYTLAIAPLLPLHPHRVADSQDELGFEYSVLHATNMRFHRTLFKQSYSYLTESVVTVTGVPALTLAVLNQARRIKARIRRAVRR